MDLMKNFKNKGITYAFVVALAPWPALAQESDSLTTKDLTPEECEQYSNEKKKLLKTKKFVQYKENKENQPGPTPKVPEGVSAEWNAEKEKRLEKVSLVLEQECV